MMALGKVSHSPMKGLALIASLAATSTILTACRAPAQVEQPPTIVPIEAATETPFVPTVEAPPPKTLVICLRDEPESLYIYSQAYLYGPASQEASVILQALYDGPFDVRGFQVDPVILESMPDLDTGLGARVETVSVSEGDVYLNPLTLQAENLAVGKAYLPAGCSDSTCTKTYSGGEVEMARMVVEFHLLPDLRWEDGEPLTAADSVFSFQVDGQAATPSTKYLIDRTSEYTAVDERTVRWTGIPGFLDAEYRTNFWPPLPQHKLASLDAEGILANPEANRDPLGWGPYSLASWEGGDRILMEPNGNYHRAAEGLPRFDRLIFRFLGEGGDAAVQQLLTGECDVLDESLIGDDDLPTLVEMRDQGRIQLHAEPAAEVVRLDLNAAPPQYEGRSIFLEPRTRQALAMCINRQGLAEKRYAGLGTVADSLLFPTGGPSSMIYDPQAAGDLLQSIGWIDVDQDAATPRIAAGVPGVRGGTPFSFDLLHSERDTAQAIAQAVRDDLAACGVEARLKPMSLDELTAPWPDGPVFGRRFDAVIWNWPIWITPLCESFAAREIPSPDRPLGINATGFNERDYDRACDRLLFGPPAGEDYQQAMAELDTILLDALPSIPLLRRPAVIAAVPQVCGLKVDPFPTSRFANLEALDAGPACE